MSRFAKIRVLVYNEDQKAMIDAGCEVDIPNKLFQREVRLINLDQITDVAPDAKEPDYIVIDLSNGDSFIVPMTMHEFERKVLVKGRMLF